MKRTNKICTGPKSPIIHLQSTSQESLTLQWHRVTLFKTTTVPCSSTAQPIKATENTHDIPFPSSGQSPTPDFNLLLSTYSLKANFFRWIYFSTQKIVRKFFHQKSKIQTERDPVWNKKQSVQSDYRGFIWRVSVMSNVDSKIFLEYKQLKTKFSVKLKIDYRNLLNIPCSAILGQRSARSSGPEFLCNQIRKQADQSEVVKIFETDREIYPEVVAGNKEKNTLLVSGNLVSAHLLVCLLLTFSLVLQHFVATSQLIPLKHIKCSVEGQFCQALKTLVNPIFKHFFVYLGTKNEKVSAK